MVIFLLAVLLLPGCWLNQQAIDDVIKDEEKAVIDFIEDEVDPSQH